MSELRESARWLSEQLAAARVPLKALSAPQLGSSSIEAGQIEEYDVDGTLVSVTGEQFDGTHAAVTLAGPVPPEPVVPSLTVGAGQVEVRWNGLFANGALSPMDFSHVAVHAAREDMFEPDNTTQKATITGESGDSAMILLESGEWSVLLVAVSKAGKWSEPSDPVPVEVPDPLDPSGIQDSLLEIDTALEGVQTSVNGKNTITNATEVPAVAGVTAGDRWQVWDTLEAGGKLVGSWRWTGTEWLAEAMDPTYLPLVDIGSGTFGLLSGGRLVVGSVTADILEAVLVLASDIVAGDLAGAHARMTPTGFKAFAPVDGGTPAEVIRMGTSSDDYLGVVGADGLLKASINSAGDVTAQNLDVAGDIKMGGNSLQDIMLGGPRGIVAWRQFPSGASSEWPTLGSGGGEIGLFEIGWDTSADNPARLYSVNVPPILLQSLSASASTTGLRLRYTDTGAAPTVTSQIIDYDYGYTSADGFNAAAFNDVLISSKNGPYIRVLVSLFSTGAVKLDPAALLEVSVQDHGLEIPQTGSITTGGGGSNPPPTNPVVTRTVEYAHTSVKSFTGTDAHYNYNTAKGYQGLSPAGQGNTKSLWTFPSLTSILTGATVNEIWAYFYFEHWYNGSGGSARIVVHGNSGQPATYSSLVLAITSNNWPRGAGRWVKIPSSLYAGFKAGTYKGFGLEGDGTFNTYGIANAARIRVKYTK